MVLLLPPLSSIPSLWSSPLLDNAYLSGHIFKTCAKDGKRVFKNLKESTVLTLGRDGLLIDHKNKKSYKIKEQHWIVSEGIGCLRAYLLESPLIVLNSSPTLADIISGIENGNQIFQRITERIVLFNDFAAGLTLKEIREDIQKLLADAQLLLSSLGEPLVRKKMAELLIPSWDSLFCIIEKHCLQQTYDIIFFKICKNNLEKDEKLAMIMKKSSSVLLGGIEMTLSCTIELFKQIEQVRSPFEKIQILEKSIQSIIDSKKDISNDELLPIFITCVIRSQVSSLYSNLELITQFTFERNVHQGEIGYLIATLEACADFVIRNEQYLETNSRFFDEFYSALLSKQLEKIDQFYSSNEFPKHIDQNMHGFCDENGNNAIMITIDKPEIVDYFIRRKCFSLSFRSFPVGDSYFHICASKGLIDSARILAEKGADATVLNSNGETPFCVAIYHGHLDFAKFLLSYNNDLKAHILVPKVFRLLPNDSSLLNYLLTFPINFNNVFLGDKSLLIYFCALAKQDLAIALLNSSRLNRFNLQDMYGKIFLHYCCSIAENYAIAASFFKTASSETIQSVINLADIDGNSCLHIAAINDNLKMVVLLLENQIDIEIRNLRDLFAFEMTTDEKVIAEILNERINRNLRTKNIGISIFSHSKLSSNGKLGFHIRSVRKNNMKSVHSVKRYFDDFMYLRECLLIERPESVIPHIRDLYLNQNYLSDPGRLSERSIRLLSKICGRLENFLLYIVENDKFQNHELLCEFLEAEELDRESSDTLRNLKRAFFEESISAPSTVNDLPFMILRFKSLQDQVEETLLLQRKISDLIRKQSRLITQYSTNISESTFKLHNPNFSMLHVNFENFLTRLAVSAKNLAFNETHLVSNLLIDRYYLFSGVIEGISYFHTICGEFETLEKHCNSLNDDLKRLAKRAVSPSSRQEDLIDEVDLTHQLHSAASEELRKKGSKLNAVAESLDKDISKLTDINSSHLVSIIQNHVDNHIKYLERDVKILQALLEIHWRL